MSENPTVIAGVVVDAQGNPPLPIKAAVSRYLHRSQELTSWGLHPRDPRGLCKRQRRSKLGKSGVST
jgi:hypothetical protein